MFTPRKVWSGLSLTPRTGAQKSGTGSGLNQNSGTPNSNSGDGDVAKGKGVAFVDAATPPSGLIVENGGKILVGSGEGAMDRDGLAKRISELENEVGYIYMHSIFQSFVFVMLSMLLVLQLVEFDSFLNCLFE